MNRVKEIKGVGDIEEFLKSGTDELLSQRQYMETLFSSGITAISAGKTYKDSGEIFYEPSSMGRQMVEIWQEHKQS